jgi:hypothetical protein
VTRWLRPSSWTAASAAKSSRFVPIQLAASTIPTCPLRSKSSGSGQRNGNGSRRRNWPFTTRHRVLASILQRASAPLKKADLLTVAQYLISHLSYSQVPALAKRRKVEAKKDSASAQELLAKQVGKYDDSELCKLLLEISLLDSAYQRFTTSRDDVLMDAAKRYRVDTEKLQKAVAKEFAAKRNKKTRAKPKARSDKAV